MVCTHTAQRRGGHTLRQLRQRYGLTLRDVEVQSARIATKYNSDDYIISQSRISEFERKGVLPSIFHFYSLALILRSNLGDLLSSYGLDLPGSPSKLHVSKTLKSHRVATTKSVPVPQPGSSGLGRKYTTIVSRMERLEAGLATLHKSLIGDRK